MGKGGDQLQGASDPNRYGLEREWVNAIRSGDRGIFRRMCETYYEPLLWFSYRYVKSKVIAEEIVQELFLWIWENREGWTVDGKLKTYLFRAAKYKSLDHCRRERTRKIYLEKFSQSQTSHTNPVEPDKSGQNHFVREVQQAIEKLPEKSRMIYKLNRLEGLTYREISEVLEISPKTVESHMSKSLDILRKQLARYLHTLFLAADTLADLI